MPELTEKLAKWTSVVLRDQIKDMPSLIRTERPVVLSDKQRTAYYEMVERHLVEIEGIEVTPGGTLDFYKDHRTYFVPLLGYNESSLRRLAPLELPPPSFATALDRRRLLVMERSF
jgi:hypothetical protein